jgi:hypothetical protein
VLFIAVKRHDPEAFSQIGALFQEIEKLLRLGLPAALTIGVEVGVFNTATALAGTLDPVSLAAHRIALNAAAVTYLVPLGIASAAAVSVGRALGAGDRREAARAGWTALGLGVIQTISGWYPSTLLCFPSRPCFSASTGSRLSLRGPCGASGILGLEFARLLGHRASPRLLALLQAALGGSGAVGWPTLGFDVDWNRVSRGLAARIPSYLTSIR